MSTKVVAIWLVIAIALGATAIYLLTKSSGPGGQQALGAVGSKLIDFVPTDIDRIEVKAPDRSAETIRRSADNTEWVIVLPAAPLPGVPAPSADGGREWPLLDARVQSFATVLGDTRVLSQPDAQAQIGLSPTTLTLALKSGRIIKLELAERTIGGTGMVRVSITNPSNPADKLPKPVLANIDDQLHRVLRTPGPRAWRDQAALRMARAEVSRIALESSGRELEIGRLEGRWTVRKPLAAPADPTAVDRLIRSLSAVSIVDFLDAGPGTAATGLSQPVASIRIEHDRRQVDTAGSVRISTLKNELVVGSVGGLGTGGADRLFARIDSDRIVLLDGKTLADLQMDPGAYIWPHPSTAAPTDIGTILAEVRSADGSSPADASAAPRVLRRDLDRWSAIAADGTASPIIDTQLNDVNRLLSFLTGTGADAGPGAAHIGAQPPGGGGGGGPGGGGFVVFGRIALLSAGSAQLEQIEIGEAGRGLVSFKTGDVYRTYPEDRLPRLVAELRARAKAAGVPIEGFGAKGPEARDPVK